MPLASTNQSGLGQLVPKLCGALARDQKLRLTELQPCLFILLSFLAPDHYKHALFAH
jgi:hypothetical protein